ncbi:aldo/keto reductase [Bythopirellula polymerisocia]|uniref:General stress protein 69 n=1 Tax=Bythopirellula polymerisocia TaxID=2528003 RepID=A0A5C6CHA2_9BACT|nr:aldo/keto reductase [Bythopirellula polymerisocia]TWU22651.1 General stress protein 69 [Bythopirellula polymerisocia]
MQHRKLGKTDLRVSEIGLGCWQLGGDFGAMEDERALAILHEATRQGITFWDTADVYGAGLSESCIGRWCQEHCDQAGITRPTIATKVGRSSELFPDKYTKERVRASLTGSLGRLGSDSLDLVQLHCVPVDIIKQGDILGWLEDFQREGLIRHYGASVETIEEAMICLTQPGIATLQIIFNLFRQDAIKELFAAAQVAKVGIIVRLPLASGLLGGKMSASQQFAEEDHRNFNRDGQCFNVGETFAGLPFDKGIKLVEELRQLAPNDMPLGRFALRWILDHPAVSTIIVGASHPSQVAENAEASDATPLASELHEQLSAFYLDQIRPLVRGSI